MLKKYYPASYYAKYGHYVAMERLSDVPLFDKILRWIDSERPDGVLELGCGLGYLGSEIADRFGAQVTGLDLSEKALTMAADRYHRPSFLRSDAIDLPFTSGSFDCVLAVNLIEHLNERDQQSLISEACRVLRAEGFLIISTPDPRSIYARIMIRDAAHARELKREEFLELMESSLRIEEVCYTNSIGRLSSTANDVLSALFPSDVLVRASRRNAKTRNYFEHFLKVYPASHALARGCEAMALSGANMQDPVMDIGCGDGSFMKVISGPYEIAVGVDRARSVMKEARKTGRYRSLVVCDAESLPFRSNSFGTIVSNSVFEHLDNLAAAMKESKRVLSVGGDLVLSVPNPRSDEWWQGGQQWVRLKTVIWRHKNLIFEQQWKSEIEKAGFQDLVVTEFANRRTIQIISLLFLPAAFWFVLARIGLPLPLFGRFRSMRTLIMRIVEHVYWRNQEGDGASYLLQATK